MSSSHSPDSHIKTYEAPWHWSPICQESHSPQIFKSGCLMYGRKAFKSRNTAAPGFEYHIKQAGPVLSGTRLVPFLIWPGIWTSIPSSVFKSYCIPIVKPLSVCPAPFIRTRIPIAAPITTPIVSSASIAPPRTTAASTTASATSSTTITATHSFLLLLNSLYYIIWDG